MTEFVPTWTQPSHPDSILVVKGAPYKSRAHSLVALPAGALFAKITSAIPVACKTYTSVQTGKRSNIELNSDLVYCNHSCSPTLEFDMAKCEVRVAAKRPLFVGDELTFFYPSTEWFMVQPFRCECGSENCLGVISGSRNIDAVVLRKYWLNVHVKELLVEEEREASGEGSRVEIEV
ncbi:hypothetical protein EYZ11_011317 [Aspergillus tanneri]|uniref:Post-SET domain-containing protein n=1 Tax=Aspergillus tanneri TaxID=1220188 RepID=A0A4S3J333_9EURO|nr:uncharacterized protein ATNIH1004_003721 [Aspergillus tanneri]KAA8651028.1 hypothetical protein ATNIH1004_003721 [Aspergillus tanneri]THC89239.1 hypothetical protein EYZ11_011317 [Aspergillus tanneri]